MYVQDSMGEFREKQTDVILGEATVHVRSESFGDIFSFSNNFNFSSDG
jgi:hypothetical protein